MLPNIVNSDTPDDLTMGICSVATMTQYPILLRLRPPQTAMYMRILLASPENRLRLMYSFAMEYMKYGNDTLILRQGLMLQLQSIKASDNFVIFMPSHTTLDLTIPHYIVPSTYSEGYVERFCNSNPDYISHFGVNARVTIVSPGHVILIPSD